MKQGIVLIYFLCEAIQTDLSFFLFCSTNRWFRSLIPASSNCPHCREEFDPEIDDEDEMANENFMAIIQEVMITFLFRNVSLIKVYSINTECFILLFYHKEALVESDK